jgi:hypothetical protein
MVIPLYKSSKEYWKEIEERFYKAIGVPMMKIDERSLIVNLIRPILDEYAICGGWRMLYCSFAFSLYYRLRKAEIEEYEKIVEERIKYFTNKQHLDPQILEEIAKSIIGYVSI